MSARNRSGLGNDPRNGDRPLLVGQLPVRGQRADATAIVRIGPKPESLSYRPAAMLDGSQVAMSGTIITTASPASMIST